jgi:hypothetical protein
MRAHVSRVCVWLLRLSLPPLMATAYSSALLGGGGGQGENFAGAARYADVEHWIEKWIMSPADVLNQHP